jgi:hypothetical protein
MSACDHCVSRNSWDCDDGWNRRRDCDSFKLDFDTLSDRQKKAIQYILDQEGDE